jgi:hypothetical protein
MSREAFEKWYMSRGWVDTYDPLMKHDHGAYIVTETCEAWQAWQAALQHSRESVSLKLSPEVEQEKLDNNRFGVTVPEWNGEGLPPVWTECEVSMSAGMFGASEWVACTILAYDIGIAEIAVFKTKAGVYGGATWDFFRPIKTEREKAIEAMSLAIRGATYLTKDVTNAVAAALFYAGYRKVEK